MCSGWLATTCSFTVRSTSASSSGVSGAGVAEVEPQLVGPHVGAGLRHVVAEPAAERGVQQVRRGVVGHRRPAGLDVDLGANALAGMQLAVLEPGDDHLVVVAAGRRPRRPRGPSRTRSSRCRPPDRRPWGRTATRAASRAPSRRPARGRRPPASSRRAARSPRTPSGSRTRARTPRRARRAIAAARARFRCSSMSSAKPASSTRFPCSPAISTVSSIGNP